MRLGVISDVHANHVALTAVLEDMPDVDRVVCAGDVVGYNPWPSECIAEIRDRSIPTVQGNHDRVATTGRTAGFNELAAAGIRYTRENLNDEQLAWLEALPVSRTVADGRVRIVHGHPENPDRYTYPREFSADLLTPGSDADRSPDVLVLGHTHVQGHATFEEGVVVNPGSVGQPRDRDPRAAYAVLELSGGEISVDERRVSYDVERVVSAIEETGLPSRLGTRLREGR